MSVTDRVLQKLFTAKTLVGAGVATPTRPGPDREGGRSRCTASGRRRRPGTPSARSATRPRRRSSTTSARSRSPRSTAARTRSRTRCATPGSAQGSSVAIMCRNHRGFIDTTVALSKLGAHALYLNTAFAGPQITEVAEREQPTAIVYDAEFENLVHDAGKGRKRFIAWHDADEPAEDPRLEDLIRDRRHLRRRAAEREGPRRHPHERHDRQPEGRPAPPARVARSGRGAVRHDPAARARAHDARRADVPLVGLRALHARHGAQLDARHAAQVRPRGHAQRDARSTSAPRSSSCR